QDLTGSSFIGFDTETTELDPYRGDLRLVQLSNGKNTVVIDLQPFRDKGDLRTNPELDPLRDLLGSTAQPKVAHNAKFDAKWVRHHIGAELGRVYDTYLASQLISAGDSDRRHGLADLAQYFLGTELDKTQQISDWSADELSPLQIEYAARDAAIMVQLREKVQERLVNDQLLEAAQLEFDCVVPIAEMELNGVFLDETLWREQLEKVKAAQALTADELQTMLSAGVAQASLFGRSEINLDSQQQVADALINLGVPMPDTTRAWQLQPLAEKYPVVGKLLEYRGVAKAISSFGENILEYIEPKTNRIHADFRQIGAPSGRFSCSNPNLQQIPHEVEYRRCFCAPEGRKLVIADYSQIELRILADFSGDQNFIDAFVSGQDFH
ncbi:MAG: DNA polymerase, partial [Pyrinomonadaceae bacterium]